MNSILQCLNQTPFRLTEIFRSDEYKQYIDPNNPRQHRNGKLAGAYGDLMNQMWREGASTIAPKDVRKQLGQYYEHFRSDDQHDSHELLEWLLNGLHEDLNSIAKMPCFTTDIQKEGRADHDIAAEYMSRNHQRNRSCVRDIFEGQSKTLQRCLTCNASFLEVTNS
jgi:ubiquitin carboxyl-terminal hydrolase 4/11/15